MSVDIRWHKRLNAKAISGRYINDRVLLFAHNQLRSIAEPYVPMRDGPLSQNVEVTPKHLRYVSPYASRMYYGIGFKFSKDEHPLATAKWDEVAMQMHRDKFIRAVSAYMRRQGR